MICETISPTNSHLACLQDQLANELKKSFGEAPAIAHAMAETADKIYCLESNLTIPGTILYSAVSSVEPAGKPLNVCQLELFFNFISLFIVYNI